MVYRIGRAHKLSKKNSQQPGVAHGPRNTTFFSQDKLNGNIDVASE